MNTLVSVVLSTYKRPLDVLKRAIDSVLCQTHSNLELFVVNDYPEGEDNSTQIKELISSYGDSRVSYLSYSHNRGACAARNFGLMNSSGKYIAFLDDDDEWISNKVEVQLNAIARHSSERETAIAYCPYYEYDERFHGVVIRKGLVSGNILMPLLKENIVCGASMPLLLRQAVLRVGGFDENLLALQDYDLWLRLAKEYDAVYIDTPLVNRFMSCDSISINPAKKKQGWEYCMKKHQDLYKDYPGILNYKINQRVKKSIEQGDYKYAAELYKRALHVKFVSVANVREPLFGIIKRCVALVK